MFLRSSFGALPFLMKPDEGDMGGSGGGGGSADAGGSGGQGGVGNNNSSGGDAGNQGNGGGNPSGVGDNTVNNPDPAKKEVGSDAEPKLGADGKPIVGNAAGEPESDKGLWGEKWRESYAGEDQKKLAELKRYESPKAVIDALLAAKEKIRTGQAREPLAKDAKPEEVAAYRKANGIPETPEGYLEKLPEGIVLGDEDKQGFGDFVKDMHDSNAPPEFVHKAVAAYQKQVEARTIALQQQDNEQKTNAIATLTQEFGPEYAANIQSMKNFITASFPKDVAEHFLSARLGDGTAIFNHPDMIRSFVRISRELNPTGTPTPGTGFDKADEIEKQIAAYEKRMHTKEWFNDTKANEHYRELINARERYKTQK